MADTWILRSSAPSSLLGRTPGVLDGHFLAISGQASPTGSNAGNFQSYDPALDVWTARATAGSTDGWGQVAVWPTTGKAYLAGGVQALKRYEGFATNTWTTLTSGFLHAGSGGGLIGDAFYRAGGCNATNVNSSSAAILQSVHRYDMALDTWSARSSMPTARFCCGSVVRDGKLYVFGGETAYGPGSPPLPPGTMTAAVEVYDPTADSWA